MTANFYDGTTDSVLNWKKLGDCYKLIEGDSFWAKVAA